MNATDCASCHTKDKPANHWSGQCSPCHNTVDWKQSTFNHASAKATDCVSCHTKDKPANHFSGQCSQCHSTSNWTGATFNHAAAKATDCVSCHTKDKPANHFSGPMLAVPQYQPMGRRDLQPRRRWRHRLRSRAIPKINRPTTSRASVRSATVPPPGPARSFNHAAQGATNCTSCHTKDKPANHFSGQCSQCHNTNVWTGASFNHAAQGATDCVSCHTKDKPANHFSGQCSQCHNTNVLDRRNVQPRRPGRYRLRLVPHQG